MYQRSFILDIPRSVFFACILLWPGLALAELTVWCDRPEALYEKGEAATFTIRATQDGKAAAGDVAWSLLKNGSVVMATGTATLANGEATVTGTMPEPGFVLCEVKMQENGKPVEAFGGAGFSPAEIKPGLPPPDDFDTFWNEQLALLAAVPADVQIKPVTSPSDKVETFDVEVKALGAPVSGYLARPVGAKPKSLPAILTTHGSGVASADLAKAVRWAEEGLLAMDINAHGLPNGRENAFYQGLSKGDLADYRQRGKDSRETIYFREMFLRLVRAIDFLTTQPEWDGRNVIVYGASQGGAQAIVAAALDKRVTFYVAGIPAMCDHAGKMVDRLPGWPHFLRGAETPLSGNVHEAVRYYDMVNFAPRIKIPGMFTVAFADRLCPPAGVYAAYNQLGGAKEIYHDVTAGHTNTPNAQEKAKEAILKAADIRP